LKRTDYDNSAYLYITFWRCICNAKKEKNTLLIPWNIVLYQKLVVVQLAIKVSAIFESGIFTAMTHNRL
jgi:hypothetical protein